MIFFLHNSSSSLPSSSQHVAGAASHFEHKRTRFASKTEHSEIDSWRRWAFASRFSNWASPAPPACWQNRNNNATNVWAINKNKYNFFRTKGDLQHFRCGIASSGKRFGWLLLLFFFSSPLNIRLGYFVLEVPGRAHAHDNDDGSNANGNLLATILLPSNVKFTRRMPDDEWRKWFRTRFEVKSFWWGQVDFRTSFSLLLVQTSYNLWSIWFWISSRNVFQALLNLLLDQLSISSLIAH